MSIRFGGWSRQALLLAREALLDERAEHERDIEANPDSYLVPHWQLEVDACNRRLAELAGMLAQADDDPETQGDK